MFAAIHLPDFHLQAVLRLREELRGKPVAIIHSAESGGGILEITPEARAAGVTEGMPDVQALARCPALEIRSRQPVQEQAVAAILLEVAHSISPLVEATEEGVCTVDLRGVRNRDWSDWGNEIITRLARVSLVSRMGVAPNPDLAWLAAWRANPVLVVQQPELFLRDLPIATMRPSRALLTILEGWGIETLGQLTKLPSADLISRLGIEASQLCERAAARKIRPLRLVQLAEEFSEFLEFECGIETLEPLLFVLRRLLDQLTRRLDGVHRVAARMILQLALENRSDYERDFIIPAPTCETEVLFRILDTHLEDLHLEQRPVGVRLTMEPIRADHNQLRLFENPLRDPNRFGETMARLIALVGPGHAGIGCPEDTHHPDSFRIQEPCFHELRGETTVAVCAVGLPLRRYRPPVAANIRQRDRSPEFVSSAVVNGPILDALGPYRSGGDWWDEKIWQREEWDVEVARAGLYRICRQENEWSVEGCYDTGLC